MTYEIDQSGKIEDTSKTSVLACTNGKKYAVTLSAKNKRRLQERFRRAGMPRRYVYTTFACCLYMLLREAKLQNRVTVDIEYHGHTDIITHLVEFLSDKNILIHWDLIGKMSPAHEYAYRVLIGKEKRGKHITVEELWRYVQKIAGGYLNFGLSPKNRYSAPAIISEPMQAPFGEFMTIMWYTGS